MFATPTELAQTQSNDYRGLRLSNIPEQERERKERNSGGYRGAQNFEHYIERMTRHVESRGGIEEPIHVWQGKTGPSLIDGHHRSEVAIRTNRLVPVVHHEGDHDTAVGSAFLGPTADPVMHGVFGHDGDPRTVVGTDAFLARLRAKRS